MVSDFSSTRRSRTSTWPFLTSRAPVMLVIMAEISSRRATEAAEAPGTTGPDMPSQTFSSTTSNRLRSEVCIDEGKRRANFWIANPKKSGCASSLSMAQKNNRRSSKLHHLTSEEGVSGTCFRRPLRGGSCGELLASLEGNDQRNR
jgi:hypothetical protein